MKRIFTFMFVTILFTSACSFNLNLNDEPDRDLQDIANEDQTDNSDNVDEEPLPDVDVDMNSDSDGADFDTDSDANGPATGEDIKNALLDKYSDWDPTTLEVNVIESDENFASGTVGFVGGGGGGYFYAANTVDGWVIVADGNGVIECSDIEPYAFPSDMIPECYNSETRELIQR